MFGLDVEIVRRHQRKGGLAGIEKGSDRDALDIIGNAVERRDDRGKAQVTRRGIDSRLRLLHRGLLVDRQIRIAAELGQRCRSLPLQACQIGLRGLQVAYRGIEGGPRHRTGVKKVLLAIVIGLRVVQRCPGLIDLFEARAIGLDQGIGLVAGDAELGFGIGQGDPIRLGVEVEERIVLRDRGVRFCRNGKDLTRDLRADRNIHRLNIGVLLGDIAGRSPDKAPPLRRPMPPDRGPAAAGASFFCGAGLALRSPGVSVEAGFVRSTWGDWLGLLRAMPGSAASEMVSRAAVPHCMMSPLLRPAFPNNRRIKPRAVCRRPSPSTGYIERIVDALTGVIVCGAGAGFARSALSRVEIPACRQRQLRKRLGLSEHSFWNKVSVSPPT